ncbi:MAG: ATP-binding protein [Sphingobacteriales bacterium]|nr:MAG: ATP-binding protein [Sphingobacteriales bacterium]
MQVDNYSMGLDLIGRLNNTILHTSKSLYPLFECIINSIHSIEDLKKGKEKGYVEIIIERDETQHIVSKDFYEDSRPIKSFTIIDNGIGFNESNFQSFRTGDSRLKLQKGSKGIGRFVWLKAFKSVKINSVFSEGGKIYERDFDFKFSDAGIENHTIAPINDKSTKTIINLINFIPKYQKHCPKHINDIALKVIDHCLVYFLYDNCPTIIIKDPINNTQIVVNDLFTENKRDHIKEIEFEFKEETFKLNILELYGNTGKSNKLHFCSNMREVKNYNLSSLIPDLSKSLKDENGIDFFIRAYVTGTYLDKIVNPERTTLSFPEVEERDPYRLQTITEEDLKEKVVEEIQIALSEYLLEIWEDKMEFVTDFIQNEAPQFRSLLKYKSNRIENLKPTTNKRTLDLELYKIMQDLEYEVKEQYFELDEELDSEDDRDEYQKRYDEYIEKVIDVGSAKLSQYIIHRKTILDILTKQLELNEDGKYSLENSIHQIIFPLKSTSDDISYDKQNLWIIDEKLSYHKYLASDLPFNQMNKDIIYNDSTDRPDVVIFNSPIALVNNDPPYQSIVILEFKRPMRKAFSEEKNPIEQIYGYIRKIHERKGTDNKGRIIQGVTSSTPSYCYLVCDITPKIAEIAENSDFTATPDNLGYFGFNKKLNAYIEIISYHKMVNDAKQRNRILFEKLNLPNT